MNHLIALAGVIDANTRYKMGQNLMLLTMTADVTDGVMLRGPISGDPISSEMPGVISTEVLVVLRHNDEITASQQMVAISKLLTIYDTQVTPDVYIVSCEPKSRPIPYPANASGLLEWAVRFVILFGLTE